MRLFGVLTAAVTAVAIVVAPAAALADFKDRVMNKEGHWGIDAEEGACAASMEVATGGIFTLRATDGQVMFAVFFDKPGRKGKRGQVQTEAYSFDFEPSFTDDAGAVYYNGDLDNRAIAALRLAKEVRVLVDGRLVHAATFENTGFDGALDAVIACSKGESGWWGPGVGGKTAAKETEPELAHNEEGYWLLEATDEPGICAAAATVDEGVAFTLVATSDQYTFGVTSQGGFKRGRRGRVETDAYGFDFRPVYDSETYFYAEGLLDSRAVFAMRRAKDLKVTVDGRDVVDMTLEGSGHAQVMTDLAACARGDKGWWGDGAKQR